MGGYYLFVGSNLEKYGQFWKNGCFSGRIWPDWGNTAWADMAGLGSIGYLNSCACNMQEHIYSRLHRFWKTLQVIAYTLLIRRRSRLKYCA